MVLHANLTEETACRALVEAGIRLDASELRLERREGCWTALLPQDRMAWFPADAGGRDRLIRERRILRLLGERCSFKVPTILHESAAGFEVRALVPGRVDPWGLYERAGSDLNLGRKIGHGLGAILAEQHGRIVEADVTGWLGSRVGWPESIDWILSRLPAAIDDWSLLRDVEAMLRSYDAVVVEPADRVLVHADVGFHNIVTDPASDKVLGIFDYENSAWDDRHRDFRYFVFDIGRTEMLEAALEVYEPATGRRLDRHRIRLYNAACAASFLAYRRGVPPDAKSCGRTLAEDLRWVRNAIALLRPG